MNISKKLVGLVSVLVLVITSCTSNVKPIDSNEVDSGSELNIAQEEESKQVLKENESRSETSLQINEERFEFLLDNKKSGGPPPDGIPPIEEPKYISVEEASTEMESREPVFLLELDDEVYIYPQRVMVWHEIVNLRDNDLALTYCPLTGSAITYKYPVNIDTTFGTSGSLINSNLLMYDRHSESFISQIDGIGLDKDLKGVELETLPTYWMEWQEARKAYPSAKVLSSDTGFIRNYNKDPYGSYLQDVTGNYYQEASLIFPALYDDEDDIFHEKYSVIGVKSGDSRVAIDPQIVKDQTSITFTLNGNDYISFYDENIQNVRIYNNDEKLTINQEDNRITDQEGRVYTLNGQSENGSDLESPIYFEVMWFAWYGFYPDTEVIYE